MSILSVNVAPMKHKCSQEMEYAAMLATICILKMFSLDIPHGIPCYSMLKSVNYLILIYETAMLPQGNNPRIVISKIVDKISQANSM